MTFIVAFVTKEDDFRRSDRNFLGGNSGTGAKESVENAMYIVKMLPDEASYLGVSRNCFEPTILVMILGSLPLIFPHFFDHFSFLYASPFRPQCPPLFLRVFPLVSPLYFTSDTTFALSQVAPLPFTFLDCQLLPAHFSEVIPPLPTIWGVSFHPSSRTIDFLANQKMPALL